MSINEKNVDEPRKYPAYLFVEQDEKGNIQKLRISNSFEIAESWLKIDTSNEDDNNTHVIEKPSNEADPSEDIDEVKSKKSNAVSDLKKEDIVSGFENELVKIVSSLRSVYDLIALNPLIKVIFPSIFIERQFEPFGNELPELAENESAKVYGVPENRISQLNAKTKQLDHIRDGISSIPANVLMGLVARFDANISSLMRFLLTNSTSSLSRKDKTIPIHDVLTAASFEDLISELVENEIHSVMRGSHESQIKWDLYT